MGAGNEFSISYQAVKGKVYKLIDALVEGKKNEQQVREAIEVWWNLMHPIDRPVAKRYLALVLAKSDAALEAITSETMVVGGEFDRFRGNRLRKS